MRKRSFRSSFERAELSWGDAWTLTAMVTASRRTVPCPCQLAVQPSVTQRSLLPVHERGTAYHLTFEHLHHHSTRLRNIWNPTSFNCLFRACRACDYVYIDYVRRSRSSSCRLLRPINCQTYITLHYITLHCITLHYITMDRTRRVFLLKTDTITRTPDPIRPTRRGPVPNQPTNGRKQRGLWPSNKKNCAVGMLKLTTNPKHHAASLRQLSFLYLYPTVITALIHLIKPEFIRWDWIEYGIRSKWVVSWCVVTTERIVTYKIFINK